MAGTACYQHRGAFSASHIFVLLLRSPPTGRLSSSRLSTSRASAGRMSVGRVSGTHAVAKEIGTGRATSFNYYVATAQARCALTEDTIASVHTVMLQQEKAHGFSAMTMRARVGASAYEGSVLLGRTAVFFFIGDGHERGDIKVSAARNDKESFSLKRTNLSSFAAGLRAVQYHHSIWPPGRDR